MTQRRVETEAGGPTAEVGGIAARLRSAALAAAIVPTIFVASVWIAMLACAHAYVRRFASPIPFMDDLEFAPYAVPGAAPNWRWLWSLANEHRLPLPRLIYVGLLRATGDFRAGMYFQVYALALLALAMILVARKLRGRTSVADAFFPLVLLHTGNSENFLLGMQIAVVCTASIPSLIVLCVIARNGMPGCPRAIAITAGLVALPLAGAAGVAQVPTLGVWALGVAFAARRERGQRAGAVVLAAGAAAAFVLCALYFVDFRTPPMATGSASARQSLATACKFLSLAIGPAARTYWPWSGAFVIGLALATVALLVRTARRDPRERLRAMALLAHVLGIALLAAAIGSGRGSLSWGAGFTNRYVIGPAPLLCSVLLAWCLYGPRPAGQLVGLVLCVVLAAALVLNTREGVRLGPSRHAAASALAGDVAAGLSIPDLAARHWQEFFPDRAGFESRLRSLEQGGFAPFPRR